MIYYDRIDIPEGIDVSKTSELKERDICHCRYFLNKDLNFNQMLAIDAMI